MPGARDSALLDNLSSLKQAGEWALPYIGAAVASAPAYGLGMVKYGVPEVLKGYGEGGLAGALGGINEAARRVPVIGPGSVDLMQRAERYAEDAGASAPAMMVADLVSPDPMSKVGALTTAAKGLGGLGTAVIPAFVGSPNKWGPHPELGRLAPRADKIGTGEGVQVFGYGHYSAEHPDTATTYAEKLSDTGMGYVYGLQHDVKSEELLDLDELMSKQGVPVRRAVRYLRQREPTFRRQLESYRDDMVRMGGFHEGGTMDEFIDSMNGSELYAQLAESRGHIASDDTMNQLASELLSEYGVHGAKYRDQLSRSWGADNPTRNFIMFRDDLTYVDPETTSDVLTYGHELGKPYRTVE